MTQIDKMISVVVCVFNEEDNIAPLLEQIRSTIGGVTPYQIIYVDDGSTDQTLAQLKNHAQEDLTIIEFRKNYGQSHALAAGIAEATGTYIVTMDGDLQNDPADIPLLQKELEAGNWDLVTGVREKRKDNFLRTIPSRIANLIIRRSSGVAIKDYGCTLKIFRKEIAKDLGLYGELHRFIPVLAHLEGARITQMNVRHHARQFGQSKYGMGRTIKVMSDLLLMVFFKKYLQRPMHLFGNTGIVLFFAGVVINLYLLWLKFEGQDIWGKPLMLLGILFLLAGIQLITFGIFVELQMRTYYESQGKVPYRIRKRHHFDT